MKQVSCSDYLTLVLLDCGSLHQLPSSSDFEPKLVSALAGIPIAEVECGEHHCAALDTNGDVYTWGTPAQQYNKGQLGHGDCKPKEVPTRVEFLE